jgi:hypothetical protein
MLTVNISIRNNSRFETVSAVRAYSDIDRNGNRFVDIVKDECEEAIRYYDPGYYYVMNENGKTVANYTIVDVHAGETKEARPETE